MKKREETRTERRITEWIVYRHLSIALSGGATYVRPGTHFCNASWPDKCQRKITQMETRETLEPTRTPAEPELALTLDHSEASARSMAELVWVEMIVVVMMMVMTMCVVQ